MNKAYNRINGGKGWENAPSIETPLNKQNLDKVDIGLDEVDNRVIALNTTKFNKTEAQGLIKNITFDLQTGILTKYYYNGSSEEINTGISKLNMNLRFDKESQILYIVNADGTEDPIDLSVFIANYEFRDSDTIAHNVSSDGTVTSIVKDGSITEDKLQPNYLADVKVEVAKAEASAGSALVSQHAAKLSEDNALASANVSAESAQDSADSAAAALESEQNSRESEETALEYKNAAKISEDNAAASAVAAEESKEAAAGSATDAKASEDAAEASASQSEEFSLISQSYAIGTDGVVRPGDPTNNAKFFSDLAKKLTDDAQKLLDQATKIVSVVSQGAIIPAGTVAFADLPVTPTVGFMYNISDAFTTDARFAEGPGIIYNAGANVYWTKDSQWDVMIGVQVTGVKGAAESDYHQGNVNITPANIGLGNVNDTADMDKPVSTAQQGAIDASYRQSAAYTDNKIAGLINGAPETLDTLGEIAQAIKESGFSDALLIQNAVGDSITINDLLGRQSVSFFTNWNDSANFPFLYGSGICIPALDNNFRFLLYETTHGIMSIGVWSPNTGIKWTHAGNKWIGLGSCYREKTVSIANVINSASEFICVFSHENHRVTVSIPNYGLYDYGQYYYGGGFDGGDNIYAVCLVSKFEIMFITFAKGANIFSNGLMEVLYR